jgi:hypothetical protein
LILSTSETSVNFYETRRRNIPEYGHLCGEIVPIDSSYLYVFLKTIVSIVRHMSVVPDITGTRSRKNSILLTLLYYLRCYFVPYETNIESVSPTHVCALLIFPPSN